MCKAYRAILLFLSLGGLTTSLSGFADQKTAQTTVGITFVTNEDVPAPNQVITSTRGDPQSARRLPETNSVHNPLLVNSGIGLVLTSGIILIIKKKKEKIMNKILLKSTMLMVATLGGTLMAVTVNAATQTTTSNITFTSGGLSIAQAPKSISFGTHAITAQDQVFSEVDTTQGKETNSSMTVGDYTGQVTKGWTLTAKLQTADFNGLELSINPEGTEAATDYATFTNQTLNGSEQPISSVTDDKMSLEKPETQFNLGAKIHVPANIHLDAKAYSNTIDWNLQNAPQ